MPRVKHHDSGDPRDLSEMDRWFFTCWDILERHLERPPSLHDFALYTKRSIPTVRLALGRIASVGLLQQDARGRYVRPRGRR